MLDVCQACGSGVLIAETLPRDCQGCEIVLRCTHCHAGWAGKDVASALAFHVMDVKRDHWVEEFRAAFEEATDRSLDHPFCFRRYDGIQFCTSAYRKYLEYKIFELETLHENRKE